MQSPDDVSDLSESGQRGQTKDQDVDIKSSHERLGTETH